MDQSRLPFVRLYDFWRKEPTGYKILWSGALVLAIISTALILLSSVTPSFFGIDVNEVSEATESWIPLWEIGHLFRTIEIDFPVYRQALTFSATPISPESLPVWFFIMIQAAGWSLLLAATTHLKTMWTYLFFLLYALFLHFSGVANYLGGESEILGYGIEFFWIIGGLIIAYARQVEWITWKLPLVWIVLFGWTLAPMLFLGLSESWIPLHAVLVRTYPFQLVLLIPFVMFVGKEPANLIVYLTTNRRQPGQRFSSQMVATSLVLVLVLELLWLLDALEIVDLGGMFIRPMYVFVLAALFVPATSLNLFGQVRKIFPRSAFLSIMLLAWCMISLSFVAVNLSVMDPIFILVFERLIAVLFFGVGLGYTVFLFANHQPLFQRKIHLYYLMGRGHRFGLPVVWLIGIIFLVIAEGYQGWRGLRLFAHVAANHAGDQQLLQGNSEEAELIYDAALNNSLVSPKTNYNLASISVRNPKRIAQAIDYYTTATSVIDFPYARINGALLLGVSDREEEAIDLLRGGANEGGAAAEKLNNLGVLLTREGKADSAIVMFQKALLQSPQLAAAAVNMAEVYRNNDRPSDALAFYQLALDSDELSAPVIAAGLEYQLATRAGLSIPVQSGKVNDPLLTYHQMLHNWQAGDSLDWTVVQALAATNSEQGPVLLDMLRLVEQDSIDYAQSKAEYFSESFPARAAGLWNVLGGAFLNRSVPEMAEYCFHQAAEVGSGKGKFLESLMMLDLGKLDSALVYLGEARILDESLWDPVSKERALLLLADGQDVYASLEYDLSSLEFEDWMRVAQYADSSLQYIPALNAYRKAQQKDSAAVAPYLELARLYTKAGDSLAFENLEAGFQLVDEENPFLKLGMVEAKLAFGDVEGATRIFSGLPEDLVKEHKQIAAALSLAQGDTSTALTLFQQLYSDNILDTEAIIPLFDIAYGIDSLSQANEVITTALTYNKVNPELWYRYAKMSKAWSFIEDAGFGAVQAIQYSQEEAIREKIAEEFEEEIRSLSK